MTLCDVGNLSKRDATTLCGLGNGLFISFLGILSCLEPIGLGTLAVDQIIHKHIRKQATIL